MGCPGGGLSVPPTRHSASICAVAGTMHAVETRPVAVEHNLPTPRTSFIRREHDIRELQRRLTTTRLLTIVGVGGAGKSRLALELARSFVGQYPDGVWLVELAPLFDGALVPQHVASVLGLLELHGQPPNHVLAGALRSKRLLLVLDNCEHLLSACAGLVDALLHACPN